MYWNSNLFERLKNIQNHDSLHDFGGGSPLNKCYIMAYLASLFNFQNYVEIGVYKGMSLFSVAQAFKDNKGKVYGIDPYDIDKALEFDLEEGFKEQVNNFLKGLDFESIFKDVLANIDNFELYNVVEIIRKTSVQAVKRFKDIEIDMLHIDGNHDTRNVQEDIANYAPLMKDGGIIVFDDIDWESVKRCYDEIKNDYIILLETNNYGILIKKEKTQKNLDNAELLSKKLKNLHSKLMEMENRTEARKPTINVGVLAYNHEKYIVECLDSIIKQKGDFNLKIIICEDKSTDQTAEIIASYISNAIVAENIVFEYLKGDENIGMVKNLKRLIRACGGSDYIALIDGDDYWADENKLQTHTKFMRDNPECSISFDSIIIYYENEGKYDIFSLQQEAKGNFFNTSDIINKYIIGNISCCFYDGKYVDRIPDAFFEMFVGDWMLNILYSQFGDIGYIRKPMTIYRKHDKGIWSGMNEYEKRKKLFENINDYNKFLNFTYDEEFTNVLNTLSYKIDDRYIENYDMVIVDDVFPHPVSGFRYQEFISYMENFKSVKVLTTGCSVHVLGKKTIYELIIDFKRKYPQFGAKLEKLFSLENIDFKLLYFVFLGNSFSLVDFAEARKIPFVFTLYPGGLFGLDNPFSDKMLKRVLESPCLKKVIVTQKVTYDYLLKKKFCKPEQIEYIFGVVTPLDKIEREYTDKKHFGIDKNDLDICFVAHKYTEYGQDKGYDIFIEVAKKLSNRYRNIKFHVVGNFDEKVIEISGIKDRIKFYGIQPPDWFDEFYKDKDIILSANIPGMIYEGSFDGFPTASCTDAGLCRTAIFCTDPLGLNDSHFKDREQIVIIEHDTARIIDKIEYYYNNPQALKNIGENGYTVIKELYGFDKQIAPRIQLFKEEISKPFIYDEKDFAYSRDRVDAMIVESTGFKKLLKKYAPERVKAFYRRHIKKYVARGFKS